MYSQKMRFAFRIVMGFITLYAQWDPAYQLVNGTELVIDGDDMTELLEGNVESYGSG